MAKTVSSAGLADFVVTGKPTQVFENDQTSKRQASESKARLDAKLAATDSGTPETPPPAAETKPEEGAKPATETPKPETHEDPDDLKGIPLSEAAQKRLDKWLAKRTAMTKTAQEEAKAAKESAEESERFAETVFNEREQWRKRAEEAEGKLTAAQPKPEPPKKPTTADFTDDKGVFKAIEYAEALAAWSAREAIEKKAQEEADARKKEAEERFNAEVRGRIDAAKAKYPDWDKKVTSSEVTLQNECLAFIARSPHGMDLAYYLADNVEEAKRIRAMDPYLAVAECGQLAKRFEKAPEPAKTPEADVPRGAPAPITPISTSGTGTIQVDPAKMDFKQLRAWHKERRRNGMER
jgi:hypothetical protein